MSKSKQHLDHVAEQLTELMETEGMNWTKSWVGQGAPINASTGATYQGINFMWLSMMAKQYEHNEWMTFKQAEAKGFKIKPNKEKMYFSTLESIEKFMTRTISRKGYTVKKTNTQDQGFYKVEITEKVDQDIIINTVISECEQIGLEYEIID